MLGSTGSIGTQTLDVVRQFPDRLRIVGLAAGRNAELLETQAAEFDVRHTSLFEREGIESLVALASLPEADVVVVSVAGVIGLLPTVAAIRAGKTIALASKEVLVAAGALIMPLLAEHGVTLRPIDSEHSAIFQSVQGAPEGSIDSLVLTASGGPFFGWTREQLADVTLAQALAHPTWSMGGKITIDSATMMNKGLEMIEARWLFGIPMDRVEVVVHRQSIIHSLVRFRDQSVIGQLGWPDMRLPIAYALLYPERPSNGLRRWDPAATPQLTFAPADETVFRCLGLAREADRQGGILPCVLNAANEEAANAFLAGKIGFLDIEATVEGALTDWSGRNRVPSSVEALVEVDLEARNTLRP